MRPPEWGERIECVCFLMAISSLFIHKCYYDYNGVADAAIL